MYFAMRFWLESGIDRSQVNWMDKPGKFIKASAVEAPSKKSWNTTSVEIDDIFLVTYL